MYERFCADVLSACPRATKRERQEICRELRDHLEDHALDMESRDFTAEEAAERSVAAMGDPGEIGRQWNRQLSPLWLWLGRMCRIAAAVLVILSLLPAVAKVYSVGQNLATRWGSLDSHRAGFESAVVEWDPEVRVDMGDYGLRIYQAGLFAREGGWECIVTVAVYAKNPIYPVTTLPLEGAAGQPGEGWRHGGSHISGGAAWVRFCYPMEERLETVTFSAVNPHGSFSVELPLRWEEAA